MRRAFAHRVRADATVLGVEVDYRPGDLRSLPVAGPFDAVICWFTSFGYFDDDNQHVLCEFARVLGPGGRLLIEGMHHDGLVRGLVDAPAAVVTERGDDVMVDRNTFDPVTGRLEAERTFRRGGQVRRSRHSVRLPTVPEFDTWLAQAGFAERRFSGRGGEPLRLASRRMVATAVKP